MLVNPLQQTSLAIDPARQMVTPPVVVQQPPPSPPINGPVQSAGTPQDKSNTARDGGKGSSNGQAQQEQVTAQLQAALAQLEQLREQASAALQSGDARAAKEAAEEAAAVAGTIRNLTGSAPDTGITAISQGAAQIQDQPQPQPVLSGGVLGGDGDDSGQQQQPLPQNFQIAFSGLDTANEVVDVAASLTTHAAEDRASIAGYKRAVLDALAGVAEIASRITTPAAAAVAQPSGINIRV